MRINDTVQSLDAEDNGARGIIQAVDGNHIQVSWFEGSTTWCEIRCVKQVQSPYEHYREYAASYGFDSIDFEAERGDAMPDHLRDYHQEDEPTLAQQQEYYRWLESQVRLMRDVEE